MSCLFQHKAPTHIVMVGYFDEYYKWIQLFTIPCVGLENAEKYKAQFDECGEAKSQSVILKLGF